MKNKIWETKEGVEIPYKELKDSHLKNIVKWIEQRAEGGITITQGGGCCPEDFWMETYEICGQDVFDRYDYNGLVKELKKRKINN